MKAHNLAIDHDGVIEDSIREYVRYLSKLRGTNYKFDEMWDYDIGKVYNVPGPMIYNMFEWMDDRKVGLVDPNCPKVIDNLRNEGFEIEIVTAHIPHALYGHDDLMDFLDKYKINFDRLSFVDVHDHSAKGKLAKHFDYMVDDAPHHIDAIGDLTKAILYEQPYSTLVETPKAWKRVQTWSRLEQVLLDDIKT